MMRTANPALRAEVFQRLVFSTANAQQMTVQGTVNRTFILLGLVLLSSTFIWLNYAAQNMGLVMGLGITGALGGFVLSLVTLFKKEWSPITAPVYAVMQGLFLGGFSALIDTQIPGIVIQAVGLTFGVLFCMLGTYSTGLIKVTDNFRLGVVAATGSVMVIYLIGFVLQIFGFSSFLNGSGLFSIGLSLVVVTIAALNLVLDFDFIAQGAQSGAPKYMEWYSAFGLMVTLVWLYIEILRLLMKLNERRS